MVNFKKLVLFAFLGIAVLAFVIFVMYADYYKIKKSLTYADAGKYETALKLINEVIASHPSSEGHNHRRALAISTRGVIYNQKGDVDNAISDYDLAIQLDPGYAKNYFNRGKAHLKKNNLELAISDYDKFLEITPNSAWAYYNRGLAFYGTDQYEKALEDYRNAIRIKPMEGPRKAFILFYPVKRALDTADIREQIIQLFKSQTEKPD